MEQRDFTREQRAIVDLGPDARLIVDAPAGTGKTHVLAGRLAVLVGRDGLEPGDEVLVLSFSRAAVLELRSRLGRLGGDAAYATSSTFDSFASRLLAAAASSDDWLALDFDGRIRAALELIRAGGSTPALQLVRHLLVDEVQDLVGARADLVLALIEQLNGGFTVFGDPAQAIYGYQDEHGGGLTTAQFYEAVRARSATPVSYAELRTDFRSTLEERHAIAEIGDLLRARRPDHSEAQDRIRSLELRLPMVSLGAAKRSLLRDDGMTSAILCRTNGEALRVSGDLFRLGIPHSLQRRGEDKVVGAWLARLALGIESLTASTTAVRAACEGEPLADDMLRDLRRMDPARGDSFDLGRIANRIRAGDVPEEVNQTAPGSLLVSTIHRAKGLEFDRVLVCETDRRSDEDLDAQNRLRYVALTRAKRELLFLGAPDVSGLQLDRASGRWLRRGFGKHRWRVYELEVVGSDASPTYPASGDGPSADAIAMQRYLLEEVRPGDGADLELDADQDGVPGYHIVHSGRVVGRTTDQFVELLERTMGRGARLPSRLTALRVEMVDTVAGDARAGRNAGLGPHGLWARLRVFGLAALEFDGALGGES